ncbi:MAG: outer membrane beta-barrel protein [Crocinitomicaceae bacterium]|jgi:hypothetical protein|nr:outer membrane beta-barrel protein [Crocinitomicaceae bacterium]MBT6030388.1 outer membrane beta-barrel protein [Crocinitomicaceae bacterium]MBT6514628.1 outer membrane beta-barrel protein [Crocinitomicaceae bacterium]
MKRLFVIILFSLATTCYTQGLFEYFKLTADDDGPEKFDRISVDFNWDSWLGVKEEIKTGTVSIGLNAYWYKDMPFGKKSRVSLAIGLGIGSHNVHHNGEFISIDSAGVSYTGLYARSQESVWKKNKVTSNYIDIPLELRFRNMNIKSKKEGGKTKSFRFYPGFKFGLMVNNHVKWKDAKIKYKVYNIDNMLRYRYGMTLRIAFNKFAIHGFYSLTPLFAKEKGDQLYPISVGVSWIRF